MKKSIHPWYSQAIHVFSTKVISVLCMLHYSGLPSNWSGLLTLLRRFYQSTGLINKYKDKILRFFIDCPKFISPSRIQWNTDDTKFYNWYMKRLARELLNEPCPIFPRLKDAYDSIYERDWSSPFCIPQTPAPVVSLTPPPPESNHSDDGTSEHTSLKGYPSGDFSNLNSPHAGFSSPNSHREEILSPDLHQEESFSIDTPLIDFLNAETPLGVIINPDLPREDLKSDYNLQKDNTNNIYDPDDFFQF